MRLDHARRQFLERLRDGLRSASDGLEKRREVARDALCRAVLPRSSELIVEVLNARRVLLRLRLNVDVSRLRRRAGLGVRVRLEQRQPIFDQLVDLPLLFELRDLPGLSD